MISSRACSRRRWSDGEIVTAVSFPKPEKAGYAKFPNPASRYAMVGVMVAKTGGAVRVAVTGAGPVVFRHKEMEKALSGNFSAAALKGVTTELQGPQQRHAWQRRLSRPSRGRHGWPRRRRREVASSDIGGRGSASPVPALLF